ncbi:MAG: DUF58 domain-containing protein [Pseudomonadota bacterium]
MNASNPTVAAQSRAEHLASRFPPLLVAAERVATTVAQGVHGRRRVGQGEAFWQFRRYEPGDQTSSIDWRQSAKSRHVFIRETEWEAAQSVWLWRDTSPSMAYASEKDVESKRGRADLILLALAALLMRGGERFSLLGTGVPPATGRAAFNRLTNAVVMQATDAATEETPPNPSATNLPDPETLPRHGQVVLLSDFLVPLKEAEATVMGFAARGLGGQLMQILDPAEEKLPFRGRVRFSGFEGEDDTLLSRVESLRQAYHGRLEHHRAGLETIARRAGWSFTTHRTDSPPESALMRLYTTLSPAALG